MELKYRNLYVVTPRAVLAAYHHLPWSDVLDAAKAGRDGLSLHHGRPILWQGPQRGAPAVPDVAYLTNGQGGAWEDKTVLHQQNWTELA